MPLRKSPQLTPQLLAAARSNARQSTGPSTPAAKENIKMNALKHGLYAAPENQREVMRALGEDPQEFDFLLEELKTTYGPGDALWHKQIDDLAQLYWRRSRLERVRAAVVRLALHKLEERQERRRQEIEESTFGPAECEVLEISLPEPVHPDARLRMIISTLEVIRQQAQTWTVDACGPASGETAPSECCPPEGRSALASRACSVLENLYQNRMGWRAARICSLLRGGTGTLACASTTKSDSATSLLRLLDEEIAAAGEQFARAEKNNAECAILERDACQAPVGDTWEMMLRQETSLDRAIDRKVRLLLALRKEHTSLRVALAGPPPDLDEAELEELNDLLERNYPLPRPHKRKRAKIAKSPEQCANVTENIEQPPPPPGALRTEAPPNEP